MICIQTRASSAKDSTLQREVSTLNTELMKLIERRNREPIAAGMMSEAERLVAKQQDNIINFVKVSCSDCLVLYLIISTLLLLSPLFLYLLEVYTFFGVVHYFLCFRVTFLHLS